MKKIKRVSRIKLKQNGNAVDVTVYTPEPIHLGKFHQFRLSATEYAKPIEKEYMDGEEVIDFYAPVDLVALITESRKVGLRRLDLDVL